MMAEVKSAGCHPANWRWRPANPDTRYQQRTDDADLRVVCILPPTEALGKAWFTCTAAVIGATADPMDSVMRPLPWREIGDYNATACSPPTVPSAAFVLRPFTALHGTSSTGPISEQPESSHSRLNVNSVVESPDAACWSLIAAADDRPACTAGM